MQSLKKAYFILKIAFRSVFGTTHGLRNVEEEWDFIVGQKPTEKPAGKNPAEQSPASVEKKPAK